MMSYTSEVRHRYHSQGLAAGGSALVVVRQPWGGLQAGQSWDWLQAGQPWNGLQAGQSWDWLQVGQPW